MTDPAILIVESDILVRHPLAEYLRECGYQVFEAGSGAEAQALLAAAARRIDIVLADTDLGDDSGFALAAWIRRTRPEIDVMLAGTVSKAVKQAGELCEQGPALQKPYDHRFVHDHIRRLIAERNRRSEPE